MGKYKKERIRIDNKQVAKTQDQKLCFCTVFNAIAICSYETMTQRSLYENIFSIFPHHNNIIDTDSRISNISNGGQNVPPEDKQDFENINLYLCNKFRDVISNNILSFISVSNQKILIAILQDLIRRDNTLHSEDIIDLMHKTTKNDFLKQEEYCVPDVLTGILLYVLRNITNYGNQKYAKQINVDYFSRIQANSQDILLVDQYSICSRKQLDSINKELVYEESNSNNEHSSSSNILTIEQDIESVIRRISLLDPEKEDHIKYSPVAVSKKITNNSLLKNKIVQEVSTSFYGIQEIINNMTASGLINDRKLSRQIQRLYEDISDSDETLSQSQIFNQMVDTLDKQTNFEYREACEFLVSYYVQRCEVFHAFT